MTPPLPFLTAVCFPLSEDLRCIDSEAVVEVFLVEGSRLSIPVDATSALQAVVRALSAGSAIESPDSGGRAC